MTTQDIAYYSKRLRQERENAARCDDSSARHVHLEMAARYMAKIDTLGHEPIIKFV